MVLFIIMKEIEILSNSNNLVKEATKLKQKKYVLESGKFLVEGKKIILEILKTDYKADYFFVEKGTDYNFLKGEKVYIVTKNIIEKMSDVVTPQGIIGVFNQKVQKPTYENGKFLILDRIQNPENMGAILRTARATDFKNIYLINSVSVLNSKTIRASMGNQFALNIYNISANDVKTLFKNAKIYLADLIGTDVFSCNKFEKNVGLVIGNEGNGISDELTDFVKDKLTLPMLNNVESLNASVSASILMYQLMEKSK